MTLIITVFAAIISTIVWYVLAAKDKNYCVGILALVYWGASLMWLMDAVAGYLEEKDAFFRPSVYEMINDSYLALYVVALGLVIWLIVLMIKDPKKVIRKMLRDDK